MAKQKVTKKTAKKAVVKSNKPKQSNVSRTQTKAKGKSRGKGKTNRRSVSMGYLTREGIHNVWSNRLMSLASVAVLTSCLMLIGLAFMLYANINVALEDVQDQSVIMVYLEDDVTEDEINAVGQDIRLLADVDTAEFVSKEDAYQQQLESLGDEASLMEGLEENPLPDAYTVELSTLENYDTVQAQLKDIDHVATVRGNSDLASQVRSIQRAVTVVCVGMIVMLLLVSLFIISNTVRVTMYNRRLEISIMKAVGATNWFIRWPFIVEGIVLGIISGLLSEGLVFGLYKLTMNAIDSVFQILGDGALPFGNYAVGMLIVFILVGILAGTVGSIVSMSRYLKEQEGVIDEEK